MTAYYNEFDKYAAQWLRNLITAGHIAPGVVDERSIEDVHPDDLRGFDQCHFFAGIGVWSLALRRAGWPDDRPVWTGSCPCQPFSSAGAGAGFADERHLWPAFHHLIAQRRPAAVLGEQVASKDADPWIDLVCADLEAMGYAFGAVPFPSAGVGAPHIRDRLYWVANAYGSAGRERRAHLRGRLDGGDAQPRAGLGSSGMPHRLANNHQHGRIAMPVDQCDDAQHHSEPCGESGDMGDAEREGLALGQRLARVPHGAGRADTGQALERTSLHAGRLGNTSGSGRRWRSGQLGRVRTEERMQADAGGGPGPTNGLWRDADWIFCRDERWRPVEPSTFPLAHGAPGRVGRLRAYGNAINAEAARIFIECVMDSLPPSRLS